MTRLITEVENTVRQRKQCGGRGELGNLLGADTMAIG